MGKKADWPWYRIKAAVEAKGLNLTLVALAAGLDPSSLPKLKTTPIPRVQAILAEAIDQDPRAVWPTRYQEDGNPVPRHQWIKNNTARLIGHVQNRRAA